MEWSEEDDDRRLDRSRELLSRSEGLVPNCAHTNSKGPTQWIQGVTPTHIKRGKGSHV